VPPCLAAKLRPLAEPMITFRHFSKLNSCCIRFNTLQGFIMFSKHFTTNAYLHERIEGNGMILEFKQSMHQHLYLLVRSKHQAAKSSQSSRMNLHGTHVFSILPMSMFELAKTQQNFPHILSIPNPALKKVAFIARHGRCYDVVAVFESSLGVCPWDC